MIDLGKRNLLGVCVDAVDYDTAVSRILDAALQRTSFTVSALAVHGVLTGSGDPVHRHRLNSLDLVVPDGQWVRYGLNRIHNTGLRDRVYGPELMLRVCHCMSQNSLPIYLYGSRKEVLEPLTINLAKRFPKLDIAGIRPSLFRRTSPGEKEAIAGEILSSGARAVFVGLGCPRQEIWVYEYARHLPMPLMAVGAAFDFHAGLLPQAPPTLQQMGLEWLYRLTREPARLWKRTATYPLFLIRLALQMTGSRAYLNETSIPPVEEIRYG